MFAVIVVIAESPVMDISPVNCTPALVIVQSFVQVKVPESSGTELVQLHSLAAAPSKQAASKSATKAQAYTRERQPLSRRHRITRLGEGETLRIC